MSPSLRCKYPSTAYPQELLKHCFVMASLVRHCRSWRPADITPDRRSSYVYEPIRESVDLSADSKFSKPCRVSNLVRDIAAPSSRWAVASRECSNVRMMVVLDARSLRRKRDREMWYSNAANASIALERNSSNLTSGED
jgi:hypothetical protein